MATKKGDPEHRATLSCRLCATGLAKSRFQRARDLHLAGYPCGALAGRRFRAGQLSVEKAGAFQALLASEKWILRSRHGVDIGGKISCSAGQVRFRQIGPWRCCNTALAERYTAVGLAKWFIK